MVSDIINQGLSKGITTAKRLAALLIDEYGIVREEGYDELEDGNVAFVRIDGLPLESEYRNQS